MMAFALAMPRKIRFGRGEARAALPEIAAFGRVALLVHGRDPARVEWAVQGLRALGMTVLPHPCPAEPTLPMLQEAIRAGQEADFVIGLGGGAALDLAKAAAALIPGNADPMDHLEVVGRGLPLGIDPLPFVAIPTTSGTGAEATRNAVIGVPDHRRKVSLRDERMIARLAIVDPSLTDGCPPAVTLASGLDAITQVIEPYLCTRANPFTDALCRDAIPMGLKALRRLMDAEDAEARDSMAWVSLSGGLALANAGLGAVHGLAGPIGGLCDAPHGAVCGTLLPHVLRANAERLEPGSPIAARMQDVRRWLSEALGAQDGIGALERWSRESGLPRLGEMGLATTDIPAIAEAAVASSSMKANPVALSTQELIRILHAAV
ncbi:iron-containing alcohol dehydrogenase [Albidovulum inexpectatum]|nr:iron-containing alcohol dehydrogenase [Albidovulum inexpectatum]